MKPKHTIGTLEEGKRTEEEEEADTVRTHRSLFTRLGIRYPQAAKRKLFQDKQGSK